MKFSGFSTVLLPAILVGAARGKLRGGNVRGDVDVVPAAAAAALDEVATAPLPRRPQGDLAAAEPALAAFDERGANRSLDLDLDLDLGRVAVPAVEAEVPAEVWRRELQTSSCLASPEFSASFASEACTPDALQSAISAAMSSTSACSATTVESELASLLGTAEDPAKIASASKALCAEAFERATLPWSKISKRGDAFDREYFAGGSDWNDQLQTTSADGTETHHALAKDASRIMHEVRAGTAGSRPIRFPDHLPAFDSCATGAAMCCHVADRQADDAGGTCADSNGCGYGSDPDGNTDVCLASAADAPVANRVERGLAVYHLNSDLGPSEGDVNCHGFAWDEEDGGSVGARLFDVALKQSLYERGYVRHIPGSPMCGCIEQMATVTRADCTKITSVSETYTLTTSTEGLLVVKQTDADIQYGPCDAGGDLSSLYKELNAANDPAAIDAKLVGDGGCAEAVDQAVAAYGYKRSVLEVAQAYFTPEDVSPAKVTVQFNAAVSDAAARGTFKVHAAADVASELAVASTPYALKHDNTALELTLSRPPASDVDYRASTIGTVHKRVANMVTLDAGSSFDVRSAEWDYVAIKNWRLANACEACSEGHFSISSDDVMTAQIFRSTGTVHPGPRSDFSGWDTTSVSGPTYSVDAVRFGKNAVQVRDWRIRQIDATHLSVTHEGGNVSRIFRADGTVHGNVRDFSGYKAELGAPTCAFLTADFLQIGGWRFAEIDAKHFSVSHQGGKTAAIYRSDGTVHYGPRTDFSGWSMVLGDVLMGSSDGCDSTVFS
ncbi:hypothetical protein ACHAWF_013511 [Thalassiosira exigua]